MSPATGIQTFDRTLQKTHTWLDEVGEILGWEDKERTFQGVRSVLHALRDRLTIEEATQLGSQLPVLLTGFYYENWKPAASPTSERDAGSFLAKVRDGFSQGDAGEFSPERLVRAVFTMLSSHISEGEIHEVIGMLPTELQALWPEPVRA